MTPAQITWGRLDFHRKSGGDTRAVYATIDRHCVLHLEHLGWRAEWYGPQALVKSGPPNLRTDEGARTAFEALGDLRARLERCVRSVTAGNPGHAELKMMREDLVRMGVTVPIPANEILWHDLRFIRRANNRPFFVRYDAAHGYMLECNMQSDTWHARWTAADLRLSGKILPTIAEALASLMEIMQSTAKTLRHEDYTDSTRLQLQSAIAFGGPRHEPLIDIDPKLPDGGLKVYTTDHAALTALTALPVPSDFKPIIHLEFENVGVGFEKAPGENEVEPETERGEPIVVNGRTFTWEGRVLAGKGHARIEYRRGLILLRHTTIVGCGVYWRAFWESRDPAGIVSTTDESSAEKALDQLLSRLARRVADTKPFQVALEELTMQKAMRATLAELESTVLHRVTLADLRTAREELRHFERADGDGATLNKLSQRNRLAHRFLTVAELNIRILTPCIVPMDRQIRMAFAMLDSCIAEAEREEQST